MREKKKIIFSLILFLVLTGCHREAVKQTSASSHPEADLSSQVEAAAEETPEFQIETLFPSEDLLVKENRVFTEKEGYPEYRIGPNDVLIITFWERTEAREYTVPVKPNGTISFAFLEDVPVEGMTASELDVTMTERLKKFIREPRIDIIVKEFRSHDVTLFGEINALSRQPTGPGRYFLKGKTGVIDLLVEAGGETKEADLSRVILRRVGGRSYRLDLRPHVEKHDVSRRIPLERNDEIYIPSASRRPRQVFVFGEVKKPGMYPYHEEMSTLEAVALAGGYSDVAVLKSARVIRRKPEGIMLVETNLEKLLEGEIIPPLLLANGDIVYVPRSFIGNWNVFIEKLTPTMDLAWRIVGFTDDDSAVRTW